MDSRQYITNLTTALAAAGALALMRLGFAPEWIAELLGPPVAMSTPRGEPK